MWDKKYQKRKLANGNESVIDNDGIVPRKIQSENKIETTFYRGNARVSRFLYRTYLKIFYLAPAISNKHANVFPWIHL